jgi:hypothetical protein
MIDVDWAAVDPVGTLKETGYAVAEGLVKSSTTTVTDPLPVDVPPTSVRKAVANAGVAKHETRSAMPMRFQCSKKDMVPPIFA